ncbi:MAG: hypothetical protein LUE24_08325 [Lachnospiraceae bacterium]|nr:hypothetical protein [Lachnospiraceae bacterium]
MSQSILYASMALSLAAVIAAVILAIRKQPKERGQMCLRETWMTAVLGVMLIALGYVVCAMKLMDETVAGTGMNSWLFVAGFQLVSQLLGAYSLLYAFVKKTQVFEERIELISAFGSVKTVYWDDIVKVDKSMLGRSLKLTTKDKEIVSISGDSAKFREFAGYAVKRIRPAEGKALLKQIETRMRTGR